MRRQPKRLPWGLCICFFFLAVFGIVWLWHSWLKAPVESGSEEKIEFAIQSGQGLDRVGQNLVEVGLIRSVPAFKFQVLLSGVSKKIQAGDFTLSPGMNLVEIVTSLTRARTDRRVTLLEGWRREEMAAEIVRRLEPNNPDYRFDPDAFVTNTATVEGKLFPDTYFFPKYFTAQQAMEFLTDTFLAKTVSIKNLSGLTDDDALILASIVEREARAKAERPVVAGILLKRLNAGWPLQADATVQYFKATRSCRELDCDWWPQNITRTDINTASAYNTYAQSGLPPAPIANPSLESIQAAYQPKDSPYWFYLHDLDGRIHYAVTIEEHNQNISRYLQK